MSFVVIMTVAFGFFVVSAGSLWGLPKRSPLELGRWWAAWVGAAVIAASVTYSHLFDEKSEEYFYRLMLVFLPMTVLAFAAGLLWRRMSPLRVESARKVAETVTAGPHATPPQSHAAEAPHLRSLATLSAPHTNEPQAGIPHPTNDANRKPHLMEEAGGSLASEAAKATASAAAPVAAIDMVPTSEDHESQRDEKLYDLIGQELDSGLPVRATWTRAFAEADGDDKRTRALYIRLRFASLQSELAERERRRVRFEAAQQERMALKRLLTPENSPVYKAICENDSFEAVRFRSNVAVGELAAVRETLRKYPHFVHLRSGSITMLELATEKRYPAMVALFREYGADEARHSLGRGPYGNRTLIVYSDGTASISGQDGVYPTIEAACDTVDDALDRA